ncbi:MAG: hypothetical protein JWM99_1718 [Verrucomicrobiales bacterium]|nr:hypothetical protein [Verrucomicrobiales bacterium]
MKTPVSKNPRLILALTLIAGVRTKTYAEDFDTDDTSGWFIRADAVARFNVKASLHAANPLLPPGVYNDGYVLADNGGTASGKTWNWGYNASSQIAGTDLTTHRFDAVPAVGDHDLAMGNPALGGEVVGGYQFSPFKFLSRPARPGFEMGYGYSRSSQNMDFGAIGTTTYTVDTYSINGIVPPLAPYAGTSVGPGPLIDLNKNNQSVVSSAASTLFQGRLETTLQSLKIGPSLDFDITRRFSAGIGLGYSAVYVDATLNYSETTAFANPNVPALNSGPVTRTAADWEPGVYFELRANYQFSRYLGAFLGADWQYNKAMEFGDPGHQIKVDLGATYAAKAGLRVRF